MTPAQQYANLRSLKFGLEEAIKDYEAQVVEFRSAVGAHSFDTSWGPLTFRNTTPTILLPTGPKLEWARQNMPHEVVEAREVTTTIPATVRPSLDETLKGDGKKPGRFRIIDGQVVDHQTGEVIDWAVIQPADPSPVFSPPRESKALAAELVAERLSQIASVVVPELAS